MNTDYHKRDEMTQDDTCLYCKSTGFTEGYDADAGYYCDEVPCTACGAYAEHLKWVEEQEAARRAGRASGLGEVA
jgi:hypothetical protein